ncbi:hypothetical protein [Metabacillus iocasae]|uniref:FtsH-binding integral membrane protein n=1 Tax=Priestia iocasae TaxID=2291674 RepID=A0ABS2QZA0_9BACI|nr:hypothetical protein [Metabacillus iocasae]MBM7704277.1 FtsH-binding integral membrane protein [Metabacillus iocasae]
MEIKKKATKALRMGLMVYAIIMSAAITILLAVMMFVFSQDEINSVKSALVGAGGFFYGTSLISLFVRAKFTRKVE